MTQPPPHSRRPLTPEDWIAAAFRALATGGVQAIRAEALARGLGVSKGSFYWHFADVPALRAAMLAHWQAMATDRIIGMVENQGGSAAARLRRIVDLATSDLADPYGGFHTEAAIRDWARIDPAAAAVRGRVDAQRLDYLETLLTETHIGDVPSMARLLYGGLVGAQHLDADLDDIRADLDRLLTLVLST